MKQSAVPISGLLSGAAVPIIGVTLGLALVVRCGALAGAGPLLSALQGVVEGASLRTDRTAPATDWAMMVPVALAYGGAAGSASVLGAFLVDAAVKSGFSIAAPAASSSWEASPASRRGWASACSSIVEAGRTS
jgi:hypothetical protein